jgi:drug/metabolite transporter superfamily protein YnfA
MMSLSSNATDAAFWGKVLAFWPFLDALILHFALAFTESEVLKNKLTYVVLYFPALLFSITDLTTTQIFTYDPILQSWGFQNTIQVDSIIARIYGVWSGIYTLLALFCLVNFHNKTVDKLKKRQTAVIAVGFFIPIVVSLFTDSIFPVMGLDVPVMGPIFASVSSIFVVYAMIKLELFKFTPEIAAENVFSTMPDAVILLT